MDTGLDIYKEAQQLEDKALGLIASKFPIKLSNGKEVDIEGLKVNRPKEFDSLKRQQEVKLKNNSLTGNIKGRIVIKDKNGKVEDRGDLINLFELPYKTQRGTYIVNGSEKAITSQMRLRPGIYTSSKGYKTSTAVRLDRKETGKFVPKLEFEYDKNNNKFVAKFGKKEINGMDFAYGVLGLDEDELRNAIGDPSLFALLNEKRKKNKTKTKPSFVFETLTNKKPTEFTSSKEQTEELTNQLFKPTNFGIGQKAMHQNLGIEGASTPKQLALETLKRTFKVSEGTQEHDNKDDLRFKYVVNGSDLILEQLDKQLNNIVSSVSKGSTHDLSSAKVARQIAKPRQGFKSFITGNADEASGLVEYPEQLNPLHNGASSRKVTQMGAGGMSDDAARNANETRDLQISGITRLDPIETPESGKIGLNMHLTQTARVDQGTILSKYNKVSHGIADKTKVVELSPEDEYDKYVAFYDPRSVKKEGNHIIITADKIAGRYKGKMIDIEKNKVQYIDPSPADIFGDPATLIPFGNHNDGNRMLMGASMQKQSVTLDRSVREEPLVQSAIDDDRNETYEQKLADKSGYTLKAPVHGTVTKVDDDVIEIKGEDGKVHKVEQYNYFPLNHGNFINNEPTVKVGDKVKKGDLIADGWQTKNGKLALGLNAKIAYLPYEGYNYEDGIVISKSFANRMRTEEVAVKTFEIREGTIFGAGSDVLKLLRTQTNNTSNLSNLGSDGIIKKGSKVGPGDILVAAVRKVDNSSLNAMDQFAAKVLSGDKPDYKDVSGKLKDNEYLKGTVLDVSVGKGEGDVAAVVTVRIKTSKPLQLGDKVAGRHGNKGTITKILPDNEMPHDKDKNTVDLIFSPLAIPSRKNLGQLMEVNAGLVAEKTKKPWKVYNFNENDSKEVEEAVKKLSKESNGEITEDGKMYLYDPTVKTKDGKPLRYDNPVTVGNMYMMKLKHKVDDKIQARSGIDGKTDKTFLSPTKEIGMASGERHNPQSIGEMEMWGLQSHGATFNILESVTLKGDGAGDQRNRVKIFNALASKDPSKIKELEGVAGTPESLKVLKDNITALGLQVKPMKDGKEVMSFDNAFDALRLAPAKDSDIIKTIGKENRVKNGLMYRINKDEKDVPEKGGIFDPEIFGTDKEEQRNKWGYIKLPNAVPLPALMSNSSYNPYAMLTPFSASKLDEIMNKDDVVVITDPKNSKFKEGEVVKVNDVEKAIFDDNVDVEFKAGGEAIKHYLKKVDVDKEMQNVKEEMKSAKKDKLSKLYSKYRVLNNLKENNLDPEDLVTNVVPVTPVYLRPRIQKGKDEINSGVSLLYRHLGNFTEDLEKTYSLGFKGDAFTEADANAKTYDMVKQLHGFGKARNEDEQGIAKNLGGKHGLVRDRMLGKKVDYSGRSVIGVDPTLNIDECALPYDMAKKLYQPFAIKKMVEKGWAKNEDQAKKMVDNNDANVIEALKLAASERPVVLNRAPSLHKYSLLAFTPKIIAEQDGQPVKNILLNPLVTPGFNADFDGDTMATHVPLTDKAVEEAKTLMKPSNNLISVKDGKMVIEIRHEMALGAYYLTIERKPKGKQVGYATWTDLWNAYKKGDVAIDTPVILNNRTELAGRHLVLGIFPEPYRSRWLDKLKLKKIKGMGQKQCDQLLREIYDDIMEEKPDAKKLGLPDLSIMINRLKNVGFKAATRSGTSLSIKDFTSSSKLQEQTKSQIEQLKKMYANDEQKLIKETKNLQKQLEDKYQSGALGDDNPVTILMNSGARGNKGVIRRMSGFVGVGVDIHNKEKAPILRSHMEGLSPNEFYLHGYDSRKGMADRALSTAEPGAVTRQMWSVNQSESITEKDCGTRDGIVMSKEGAIVGRAAAVEVRSADGKVYAKAGQFIDKAIADAIRKDDSIKMVKVRSVMSCETVNGTCQKCYGWEVGKTNPPELGTAIGTIAAQSVGEPMTQMVMRTFHGGGDASSVSVGMPRIHEILNMAGSDPKKAPANVAVLAKNSGIVTDIKDAKNAVHVYIGNTLHVVSDSESGHKKPLRVKVGDTVNKGDFLTVGSTDDIRNGITNITSARPYDIMHSKDDAKEGIRATQEYLASSMQYAINASLGKNYDAVDRRHVELTVSKLTENVKILDSSVSPFVEGQEARRTAVEKWNKEHATPFSKMEVDIKKRSVDLVGCKVVGTYKDKHGQVICGEGHVLTKQDISRLAENHKTVKVTPAPIKYEGVLRGVDTVAEIGHDNWLSNTGHRDFNKQIARGAAFGQTDTLSDSRARLMTGKVPNIGKEGFNMNKKHKDLSNSFANSIANLFKK